MLMKIQYGNLRGEGDRVAKRWAGLKTKKYSMPTMAVFLSVLAGAVLLVWTCLHTNSEKFCFDNENVYQISGAWQVSLNGRELGTVTLEELPPIRAGDTAVYRKTLTEQETTCNSLMFRSVHQYVKVYLDGELLLHYGDGQQAPAAMSPGALWQYTRLPNDWQGKELAIELTNYYNHSGSGMGNVLLGTKAGLVYHIVKDAAPILLSSIPAFILGIIMIFTSFCFQQQTQQKLRYLGIFTTVMSAWIILEAQVTQVVTGDVLLTMNLVFILFSMLPVVGVCYLQTYPIFSKCPYMKWMLRLSVANELLVHGLRLLGKVDYMTSVVWVQGVLILIMAGICGRYIREKLGHRRIGPEERFLLLALVMLSAFGMVDILRFYMPASGPLPRFSSIGLASFVLILGYSAIRQEARARKDRIEEMIFKRLAYTDILTGLKNRTAFEEEMERLRREGAQHDPIIMVADMNCLKWINDNLGHKAGDQALIVTAELLKKHFGGEDACYRLGGDEFCVLTERCTDRQFTESVAAFIDDVSVQEIGRGHKLSIACGFVRRGGREIDQALVEADAMMYQEKSAWKRSAPNV